MKIILFGKNGQVGHEIVKMAPQFQAELLGFNSCECNVTDPIAIENILKLHHDADFVINATAYTQVDQAEEEIGKAYQVNRDGVRHLATRCKKFQIPLFHLSTDYVFNGTATEPYSESDQPDPVGVYGMSKYAGEKALQAIYDQYYILRVSWVFGAHGKNFVKTILNAAKTRPMLSVVDDQQGAPTPASDIARVVLTMIHAEQEAWGVYHYTAQPVTTWYHFAKAILEQAKIETPIQPITTDQFPTKAKRPSYSVLSTKKIKTVFGIEPHDWRDYLQAMIE